MKKKLLLLSAIIMTISVNAGDINAFISANLNILKKSSIYEMSNLNFNPANGVTIGVSHKTDRDKFIEFLSICDYSLARNTVNNLNITSQSGENISGVNGILSYHSITLSGLGVLETKKAIYFGMGISASLFFSSRTKVDEYYVHEYYSGTLGSHYNKEKIDSKTYKNKFYSPLSLSIPVKIGFDLNRFDIFMSLNVGIKNRLKRETFIKEYNNLLQIGIGYNFTKFK